MANTNSIPFDHLAHIKQLVDAGVSVEAATLDADHKLHQATIKANIELLVSKGLEFDQAKTISEKMHPFKPSTPPGAFQLSKVSLTIQPEAPAQPSAPVEPDLFEEQGGLIVTSAAPTPPAPKRKPGRPKSKQSKDVRTPAAIRDLIEASIEVEEMAAREAGTIGFMTSIWACASMPHAAVEGHMFKRSNGVTTLKIVSDPDYGLPYGRLPRIMMAWICTEAKKTSSRQLLLGRSQTEFMAKLGMTATGGKNGSIPRFKEQATRLLHSMISLTSDRGNEHRFSNMLIAKRGMLLWDPRQPDQPSLWDSTLTLDQDFYAEIEQSSVPIDMRVINALRSPLAIDIYLWLTWRLREIKGGQTVIPWQGLKLQFGSNYEDSNQGLLNFKSEFQKKLRDVRRFYPAAKVFPMQNGLKLMESPPHIPMLTK